jgi:hypothetical protein
MPQMLKALGAGVLLLLGAALAVLIQKASGLDPTPSESMSYAEFTSVILTALGVILAALTIFLGAIAFIGWSSFEALVQRKAREYLTDKFGADDPVTSRDMAELEETIRRELGMQSNRNQELPENVSPFDEDVL